MDKLRALRYFIATAGRHSLSGAARELGVSVTAVAKLVNALEREIGVKLFDRTVQGLTLTADGVAYLETCRPLLEQLDAADIGLKSAAVSARGTLVVGAPTFVAQHWLLPALRAFAARYPEIRYDVRVVERVGQDGVSAVEVFVVLGWPERGDLVHRVIAQTRFVVCASPAYWAAHGVPQRPLDLERHNCMAFRTPEGTLLDLWDFDRGNEHEAVAVQGWLTSDHRDVLLDAAFAGEGVIRMTDLLCRPHLASGRLVPALLDWEARAAPPLNLLYRPNLRRTPRVRLFVDFVSPKLREQQDRDASGSTPAPEWSKRHYARASTTLRTPTTRSR